MTTDYLSAICASHVTPKLITFFVMRPGRQFHVAGVSTLIAEADASTRNQLHHLQRTGLLVSTKDSTGRRYFQLNPACPVIPEIRRIAVASRQYPVVERA